MKFFECWRLCCSDFSTYYKGTDSLKSRIGATLTTCLEPGFWACWNYRWSHYLFLKKLRFLSLILMRWNKWVTHVDISYEARIGEHLRLPHCFDIVIGATAEIGDHVEILNGVTLGATDLRTDGKRHPTIEDGVLIGSGAKVLGDIVIGKNARIGANSVVTKSVAPETTVVGIPAKPSKKDTDTNESEAI